MNMLVGVVENKEDNKLEDFQDKFWEASTEIEGIEEEGKYGFLTDDADNGYEDIYGMDSEELGDIYIRISRKGKWAGDMVLKQQKLFSNGDPWFSSTGVFVLCFFPFSTHSFVKAEVI